MAHRSKVPDVSGETALHHIARVGGRTLDYVALSPARRLATAAHLLLEFDVSLAPGVSIVLPVFNDDETIEAALHSCVCQTLTDVEIICVDDGSTDRTVEIIEQYMLRDRRIRLLRQHGNRSAFQARGVGVAAASREYVLFLDGDDELNPNAAQLSCEAARRSGADLVGFGVEVINADGKVMRSYQARLAPRHTKLNGEEILSSLFPIDRPAQGQLWRNLFRTDLLREAYALLPQDVVLPRVNDLPLMFIVAALATHYVSISPRLYRYHYGRGGSGHSVDTLDRAKFYADAIRSIDSARPAVDKLARVANNPGALLDTYESVRLSLIGYVCAYLLKHCRSEITDDVVAHMISCVSFTDLVVAAVRFYPSSLDALKKHSAPLGLGRKPVRNVMLTTRMLTTGGVSSVLLAQAEFLMAAGHNVTIVARRYGSDPRLVPTGATFVEMCGRGLAERLDEWAGLCDLHEVDVIIDHQILYSRDWPEYALVSRGLGIPTIGWIHNFAARPIYDLNGLHELLKDNASLLESIISLSPLDVAFWKLRGVQHSAFVPNPPSTLLLESATETRSRRLKDGRRELVWWGRLDERTKQVTQLIDVAEELRRLSVDFHLTIIGPDWGDWTAARFNALVNKRGLDQHIDAIGELRGQELVDAIDAADAFVTTSIIEGYQLTIAEAQSRGLPVFMYELPWLTLVQNNDGVIAVRQGDSAGLAEALAATFESAEKYERLSAASIEAALRVLSYDFSALYTHVVNGTLPAEFSPESTVTHAQQLLDLMIFYAERNAGVLAPRVERGNSVSKQQHTSLNANRPIGVSIADRAWRAAAPFGRIFLQLFPRMRPLAHRVKNSLIHRSQ